MNESSPNPPPLWWQAVVATIGSGNYTSSAGYGSYANLEIAEDGDTVRCVITWSSPDIITTQTTITVRDGPVLDDDDPGYTGVLQRPLWHSAQAFMWDDTQTTPVRVLDSISIREALPPANATGSARIIGCVVEGVQEATLLPITIRAVSKLISNITQVTTTSSSSSGTASSSVKRAMQATRGDPSYRYFKWQVTQTRLSKKTPLSQMSISEFFLFHAGVTGSNYYWATQMSRPPEASTPGAPPNPSSGPQRAIDTRCSTDWVASQGNWTLLIDWKKIISAGSFAFCTSSTLPSGYDPLQWTLDGSVDGNTWVRLHTQTRNASIPVDRATHTQQWAFLTQDTRAPTPAPTPRRPFIPAKNTSAIWQDYGYPLYRIPSCLESGCISTVVSNVKEPSLISTGPAVNWPGYENRPDTLFIATIKDRGGLRQISASMDPFNNLTDATYSKSKASVFTTFKQIMGLDVDADGNLFVTGIRPGDGTGVIVMSSWSPQTDDFSLVGTMNISESLPPVVKSATGNRIACGSIDGSWRNPFTGEFYGVNGNCVYLYRITKTCASFTKSCLLVEMLNDLVANASLAVDTNTYSRLQNISVVGDVRNDILYVGYGGQCGIMAFSMKTGEKIGWLVAGRLKVNQTEEVDIPLCGYAGKWITSTDFMNPTHNTKMSHVTHHDHDLSDLF